MERPYIYRDQLLEMDRRSPQAPCDLPPTLCSITTPLKVERWAEELQAHPDQVFSNYILQGIRNGFRIGFNYQVSLASKGRNLLSATEHADVVDNYLDAEKAMGRIAIVPPTLAHRIHISPFGVIPKRAKPGKWRLIVDLLCPEGRSVNDGIERELCSLSYISIDQVVDCILNLGTGSLMAKVDIAQAYRNVPVHPEDRPLLGMKWGDVTLVDKVLPFGLRSAPLIFTALADALQWIIQRHKVEMVFHYLDDYITIGPPDSDGCQRSLSAIVTTCKGLGVPLEEDKCEGPATALTFLGMELDSVAKTIRLPDSKLSRLKELLDEWKGKKSNQKERPVVTNRFSPACLQGYQAGSLFSSPTNRPEQSSQTAGRSYSPESISPLGYSMVAYICREVERAVNAV